MNQLFYTRAPSLVISIIIHGMRANDMHIGRLEDASTVTRPGPHITASPVRIRLLLRQVVGVAGFRALPAE